MKPNSKPHPSWLSRSEFIRICNEKLICAARDLAEFTKNGITASYIVALAHKCEHYEDSLNEPQKGGQGMQHHLQTEEELSEAVAQICEMGRKIWSRNPGKYSDYVISMRKANA